MKEIAQEKIVELNKALGVVVKDINSLFTEHSNHSSAHLSLPAEYKSFLEAENTPDYRNALKYLRENRGFTNFDIIKYHLGFCESGQYRHKIIIPSYNLSGSLNFFVGRDFYGSDFKHKNPNISKDIVGFELYINWNLPIVLVEGAIDAMTIKRNAIPLFGKTIPNTKLGMGIDLGLYYHGSPKFKLITKGSFEPSNNQKNISLLNNAFNDWVFFPMANIIIVYRIND
jgi:hypothetical protein